MRYDVIAVGGGLAGSTLAKALAERGYRVLVLEREARFKDRVRGEQMHPWGVAEARTLGISDALVATGGHQTRRWRIYQGAALVEDRDLAATTPHGVGSFNCYHPAMQDVVLGLAVEAGAEVRRGVTVEAVAPGDPPSVRVRVGHRLVRAAVDVCRDRGYPRVYLWTFEGLHAARHLYETAGFQLVEQRQGTQWGAEVTEQRFELRLARHA